MLIWVGIGSFSSDGTALSYGHWNYKSRLKGQAISELENIPKFYAICVEIYLLYSSDINIYASIYLHYVVKTKLFMSVNFRVISLIISTTDYNIIISLIFTIRVISLIISTTYYNIIISLIFTISVISLNMKQARPWMWLPQILTSRVISPDVHIQWFPQILTFRVISPDVHIQWFSEILTFQSNLPWYPFWWFPLILTFRVLPWCFFSRISTDIHIHTSWYSPFDIEI